MRFLATSIALAAAVLIAPPAARADEWKTAKEDQGVRVSSRHVGGSPVLEIRAVTIMDFPAERVFAVLRDIEHYPEIMPPTIAARLLKSEGHDVLYYYMEIDPPVIARRYYCMRAELSRLAEGVLRSEWRTANELCPEPSGRSVRMEENRGVWTLKPLDAGHTLVTYQAHSDPGGSVPTWMVNRALVGSTAKVLVSLRKAAAMPRYEHEHS